MSTPLIDLSYLQTLSGNDSNYMFDVLNLFLDTVTDGLNNLKHLVRDSDGYDADAVRRQAHSLKSTTSIIHVRDMNTDVKEIELLAIKQAPKPLIEEKLEHLLANFNEALPHLLQERDRNSPKA